MPKRPDLLCDHLHGNWHSHDGHRLDAACNGPHRRHNLYSVRTMYFAAQCKRVSRIFPRQRPFALYALIESLQRSVGHGAMGSLGEP